MLCRWPGKKGKLESFKTEQYSERMELPAPLPVCVTQALKCCMHRGSEPVSQVGSRGVAFEWFAQHFRKSVTKLKMG